MSHIEDGATILLDNNVSTTRYINVFSDDDKKTLKTIFSNADVYDQTGLNNKIDVAITALIANDLTNVSTLEDDLTSLSNATVDDITTLIQTFLSDITTLCGQNSIGILYGITDNITDTNVDVSAYITMLRTCVLAQLGSVIPNHTFDTSDDAMNCINRYVNLHDKTISACSDLGLHDVCNNLNNVRSLVLQYLQNQLSNRPNMLSITFNDCVPDVVAAYSIYGNLDYVDDIIKANNIDNPLLMTNEVYYPNV